MISREALEKLLPSMEQDRIEKTISVNDANKFGEAICAFANDLAGEDEASDFEYEHRFEGDLTTQLGQMEEFIKANIVKMVLPELGGDYVSSYPLRAVKELLFNAVIHKDYQSNAPIKFYEFSDRIEISNAGGLYGKARPENFPNENDYRNPAISEAVKNLGFVNGFNVGVKAAMSALNKNGSPAPEFIKDQPTSFLVKIYKRV
jgi:ATP-dependent DNA helicase RecG